MDHKLSVVVQVDLDGRYVHLVVTGCLTEHNHHGLSPLLHRARTLVPGAVVTVDLTHAHHVETSALELLERSVAQDHGTAGCVRVLTRPVPFGFAPAAEPLLPAGPWGGGDLDGVAA